MEEVPRSRRRGELDLLPSHFPGGEVLGPYDKILRTLSEETIPPIRPTLESKK
jgi:hypothetical protein